MALERVIHCGTNSRILRRQRGAANEVARLALLCIGGDPSPEKRKHLKRAMLAVYGSAAKFDDGISQGLVRREIELARAVVTQVCRGGSSSLQAIRPHELMGPGVLDDEVVANGIKFIGVVALLISRFETFSKFQVEYEKAQPVRRFEVVERFGKAQPVDTGGQVQTIFTRRLRDARRLQLCEEECLGH